MAEDITDVYIATEAGDAGWQSLTALAAEQVDAKLPIYDSTEPAKVDGTDYGATVELSAPDDFQFAISTRDPTDVLNLDFVTRLLVNHTGAFFYLNVSTDQVDTNAVSVKDDEDLTIYGFQDDDSKKQVLLKSRDGVSGTDSYEPTDDDSLVPKSYVDNKASSTHKLPIKSDDNSVTLQSPEVNKYQIIVGGASRMDVSTSDITFRDSLIFSEWKSKGESPSKITLDNQATVNVGGKVFNIASNESDLAEGDGGVYAYNRTGVYSVISNGIHFNSNAAGGVKSVSWQMNADGSFAAKTSTQSIQCSNYFGQSPNQTNGVSVTDVVAISVNGEAKVEVSSEAVKVRDQVWCNKFLPYAGAGAELALSDLATWTIDSKLLQIASNTSSVAGGTGLYLYNRTDDLSIVSNGIRFNSNAAGGVTSSYWVMETNGDFIAQTVNQEIECTNYRGQGANTVNGFTVDSSVKVTVGGETKLNISDTAISSWPDYEPSGTKDLATKEYTDGKIWVGTTASYNNVNPKLPGTLYCITD